MLNFISGLIDRAQEAFPINRVVAILTPVFATVSGALATYAVQKLPYIATLVPNTQVVILGVFVAGAGSALAAAYKWLDGWQKHEAHLVVDTADLTGQTAEEPDPADQGAV